MQRVEISVSCEELARTGPEKIGIGKVDSAVEVPAKAWNSYDCLLG